VTGNDETREDDMTTTTERPAAEGELCTCGRDAVRVYVTGRFGEVGHCGIPGAAPITPCPFCGSAEPHPLGARCPKYRLRP
jgi:hypothetical protein